MALLHGYPDVVGELIRTTATADKTLDIELALLPITTVRALAQYSITVALPWLTEHAIVLITPRGQVQRYTVRQAMEWLHACMPGSACMLTMRWPDASGVARQWTPGRIAGQVNRIAALSDDRAMIAAAQAAGASSSTDARAAARAMAEAGAMIRAMRGQAPWPVPVPDAPWIADAGMAGNRAVPMHAQNMDRPDQYTWTASYAEATHVWATAVRDEQARPFWGVGASATNATKKYPRQYISVDTMIASIGGSGGKGTDGIVQPPNGENAASRPVRYAVIRLSDGAIIRRVNMSVVSGSPVYVEQPITNEPPARYLALSPDDRTLGASNTIEGAHAAARAALAWTWRMGNGYGTGAGTGPEAGDPMRWVLCDLVNRTENTQETLCDGTECVNLIDDAALPVRP